MRLVDLSDVSHALVCDPRANWCTAGGDDVLRWALTPTASGARLALADTFDKRD